MHATADFHFSLFLYALESLRVHFARVGKHFVRTLNSFRNTP